MSIDHCLANAVAGNTLDKSEAERLRRLYEGFRERRSNSGPAMAEEQAKKDLLDSMAAETAHKRRQAKLALKSIREVDANLRSHRTPAGRRDMAAAAIDMLEHFGTAGFSSVAGRQRAIVGMAHAKMEEMLHHFRRGALAGDKRRQNAADLKNVLREAFGVDSGDAKAKELAAAWKETHEWLRQRFNAAGGAIGKLENWGLPQHHDPRALRKAGRETWKASIRPLLDLDRMRHPLSGQPIGTKELDAVLDEIFDTVTTEGWIDRKPLRQRFGKGPLANQRAEHRFLVFRDPEGWLGYQKDFGGGGDIFAAMMGHINMMAKDIAAMEVLGPNPAGTIEWIKQAIEKEAQEVAAGLRPAERLGGVKPDDALSKSARTGKRLDAVWGSIRGELETPVNAKWANGLAAGRSIITASVLGSAAISSISDVGTSMIARRFAGLPAGSAIPEIVKGFSTLSRREAVQAGLIMDSAMNVFHAQARYVGTLSGPQWANYVADRVLTLSGLTPWTQAARHAFGLAFQAEIANQAGKALGELPDAFGRTLRRYGFTQRQWDLLRRAEAHEGQMIRPAEVARLDEALAEKYLEMVQTETEFAVPNGSHRSRTMLVGRTEPGTPIGEALRSFAQFKSFGAVFVLLHGARMHGLIASGEVARGATYAGSLLLSTTLFGAVALELKQSVAGRDMRDPTTPAFWGAALLQGGGLGIYGDFLFSDINRHGGGFSTTLAGPLVERANDIWTLTAGNAIQLFSGEKTHFGRELVKFARGNFPGSNIWYMRLAWERTVMDQLQWLADPEANKAFKRQQQFWKREFGQEYWWKPGEMLPGR